MPPKARDDFSRFCIAHNSICKIQGCRIELYAQVGVILLHNMEEGSSC